MEEPILVRNPGMSFKTTNPYGKTRRRELHY
jgi:hypothetical protein